MGCKGVLGKSLHPCCKGVLEKWEVYILGL